MAAAGWRLLFGTVQRTVPSLESVPSAVLLYMLILFGCDRFSPSAQGAVAGWGSGNTTACIRNRFRVGQI